ncbi:3'-5' exonuclease [Imbroritus primus]|jgi:DNA polymerase-3 subunit epsilon|uniref:3'-5' exonuclease n=1 Tax=Imbroritus primus TaxID=3058603 RepID=UPI0002696A9A
METVAVLDFETTGLSPGMGDRATEIAVTLVRDGHIVDRYQSLMNAGKRIPAAITALTGITNAMIDAAPPAATVMREAARFVGDCPVVAHNAAFDRKFWQAELARVDMHAPQRFACTLLVSRRLFPHAPDHKLGTLIRLLDLPQAGRAHRALADAEMASHLWVRMQEEICQTYRMPRADFDLLAQIQATSRAHVPALLRGLASIR